MIIRIKNDPFTFFLQLKTYFNYRKTRLITRLAKKSKNLKTLICIV